MRKLVATTGFGAYLLFVVALVYVNAVSLGMMSVMPMHFAMIAYQFVGVLGAALLYSVIFADERAPWPSMTHVGSGMVGFALVVVTAIVLGIGANITMGLVLELVPQWQWIAESYAEQMKKLVIEATGLERLLGVTSICVTAPIVEEALFRGTMLPEQLKSQRVWVAVLVNGALFAAFHLNPVNFLPLLPVGAYLAHVTIRTESLVPALVAHAVLNTFNGVLIPELFPEAVEAEKTELTVFFGDGTVLSAFQQYMLAFVVVGAVAGTLWWLSLRFANAPDDGEQVDVDG